MHFVRYQMYEHITGFLDSLPNNLTVAEFGNSNYILQNKFKDKFDFKVFTYPPYDIRKLDIPDNSYDIVIIDMVLEHIDDFLGALRELHRVVRPNGWLIVTMPFLYRLHGQPSDYWRFTRYGLKALLSSFFNYAESYSWGNKQYAKYHLDDEYMEYDEAIRKGFDLSNTDEFQITVWGYARK